MKFGLDTSVVVRLLTDDPPELAAVAARRIEAALEQGDAIEISDLAASETYFALQHHYRMSKTDALAALRALLSDERVESSGAAAVVLDTPGLATAEPGFVDRLIHALYAARGARLLTFERSARRLADAEVLAG